MAYHHDLRDMADRIADGTPLTPKDAAQLEHIAAFLERTDRGQHSSGSGSGGNRQYGGNRGGGGGQKPDGPIVIKDPDSSITDAQYSKIRDLVARHNCADAVRAHNLRRWNVERSDRLNKGQASELIGMLINDGPNGLNQQQAPPQAPAAAQEEVPF